MTNEIEMLLLFLRMNFSEYHIHGWKLKFTGCHHSTYMKIAFGVFFLLDFPTGFRDTDIWSHILKLLWNSRSSPNPFEAGAS